MVIWKKSVDLWGKFVNFKKWRKFKENPHFRKID